MDKGPCFANVLQESEATTNQNNSGFKRSLKYRRYHGENNLSLLSLSWREQPLSQATVISVACSRNSRKEAIANQSNSLFFRAFPRKHSLLTQTLDLFAAYVYSSRFNIQETLLLTKNA